jgi:phage gp45-like
MKKQLLLILFLFASYNLAFSQYILKNAEDVSWYQGIAQEKVVVQPNETLLFAGESMYYTLYCFDAKTNNYSNNSKIAYVELVGENTIVFKQKIKLIKGVGNGDFFVPPTVKSGNYKLIGYTQWMKNGDKENFFQTDIVILNPYEANANVDEAGSLNDNFGKINNTVSNQKQVIEVQTDAKIYKTRAKVSLNVNLLGNGFGNYSVSVRKKDDLTSKTNQYSFGSSTQNTTNVSEVKTIGESIYLPEFVGEMITGKVLNKLTGKPEVGKDVVLSVLSEEVFQDIVKTNDHGVFYFQLKDNYSKPDALVQVLGADRDTYSIVINEHEFVDYRVLSFKKFQLSKEHQDMIVERSIHNQVQNAYFSVKQDTLKTDVYPESFFGNPPTVYQLDDYKRFPTLAETFVEVIDHVWDQKAENGKRSIDVREREFDPYYGIDLAPMVLVDGVFIQDHQSILDFDATKVKTIKVHREEYYYGKIVYQGIVRIETFDGNYAESISGGYLKKFNRFSTQPAKGYFNQDYSKTSKDLERIPDFREQLLWYSNLEFTKQTMNFQFFTSDVKGDFEIVLKGFTNLGESVYLKENIVVK